MNRMNMCVRRQQQRQGTTAAVVDERNVEMQKLFTRTQKESWKIYSFLIVKLLRLCSNLDRGISHSKMYRYAQKMR
jgi:hypothetical protein